MQSAETVLGVLRHWRAGCLETGQSGSTGGRAFARSSGELRVSQREPKDAQWIWGELILGFVLNPVGSCSSAGVCRSCRATVA